MASKQTFMCLCRYLSFWINPPSLNFYFFILFCLFFTSSQFISFVPSPFILLSLLFLSVFHLISRSLVFLFILSWILSLSLCFVSFIFFLLSLSFPFFFAFLSFYFTFPSVSSLSLSASPLFLFSLLTPNPPFFFSFFVPFLCLLLSLIYFPFFHFSSPFVISLRCFRRMLLLFLLISFQCPFQLSHFPFSLLTLFPFLFSVSVIFS